MYIVKPFQCYECDKKFSQRVHLKHHKDRIHGNLPKNLKCDVCNEMFNDKEYLKRHIVNSHKKQKVSNVSFVKQHSHWYKT